MYIYNSLTIVSVKTFCWIVTELYLYFYLSYDLKKHHYQWLAMPQVLLSAYPAAKYKHDLHCKHFHFVGVCDLF